MGSIEKLRLKNGEIRYRARYRIDGRQKEKRFKKKADASRFLAETEADVARGEYLDPSRSEVTVAEWADTWLESRSQLKEKTLVGYRSLLDVHVLPEFGSRSLGSVRVEDVGRGLARLQGDLSASRVRQAYTVLHNLFRLAVDYERLQRNPAANDSIRRSLPRPEVKEMEFLSMDEVVKLSESVPSEYRVLVLTLAISGLRWGEATALRRKRVEILRSRIHVAEAVTEVRGRLVFGTTKSGRARWVVIPRFLAEEIGAHMESVPVDPDSLLFTASDGSPLRNSNFRHRIWKPAIEEAGLSDKTRLHDLRHTAASLMVQDGASLFLLQKQLGHASIATTQRYSHLYPDQGIDLAERMDSRYRAISGADVGPDDAVVVSMSH